MSLGMASLSCAYLIKIQFKIVYVMLNELYSFCSLLHYRRVLAKQPLLSYRRQWWPQQRATRYQLLEPTLERKLMPDYMLTNSVLRKFIFTAMVSAMANI